MVAQRLMWIAGQYWMSGSSQCDEFALSETKVEFSNWKLKQAKPESY